MIQKNKSIQIDNDYVMIFHNPITDEYQYLIYHILDMYNIEGKSYVNIQYHEDDSLKRVALPYDRFLNLVTRKILTPLQ